MATKIHRGPFTELHTSICRPLLCNAMLSRALCRAIQGYVGPFKELSRRDGALGRVANNKIEPFTGLCHITYVHAAYVHISVNICEALCTQTDMQRCTQPDSQTCYQDTLLLHIEGSSVPAAFH
jgi:hypothetical protein